MVNSNEQLLVADIRHHCIYTYTLDGNYVSKQGFAKGQLICPFSLTTDLNGFIFVVEWGNHCVSVFNEDGKFMYCFGSAGTHKGEFRYPAGIAFSPKGNIYIGDQDNRRVQIFSTSTNYSLYIITMIISYNASYNNWRK